MEFFENLLDSYKRLKSRKLRLVEAVDPEQKARQEYQNAKSKHPEPTLKSPYIAIASRTKVAIFKTSRGWKYAPVAHTKGGGNVNPGGSRFIDQDFERFVSYFKEKGEKSNSPAEVNIENPESQVDDSGREFEAGGGGEVLPQAAPSELATDILPIIEDIYAGVPKDLVDGKIWGDAMSFGSFITGGPDSIETKITSPRLKIIHNKLTDQYTTTVVPPNQDSNDQLIKNIKFCLECLLENNISEDSKIKIKNFFVINSDQSVTILSDTKESGITFQDSIGFMKMLISALSKKFKIKIRTQKISDLSHVDWAARGLGFNEIFSIVSLIKYFHTSRLLNPKLTQAVSTAILASATKIKSQLLLLNNEYSSWFSSQEIAGVEMEEKKIIDGFTTLLNPTTGPQVVSILIGNMQKTYVESKADFIIPRLRETEDGRKQDTFFVYRDFGVAKSYLLSLGFKDSEITLNGMIKELNIEEVFKTREELLAGLISSGEFILGQIVYYIPVWYRNYFSLNNPEIGFSNSTALTNFISGVSKDPDKLFIRKFNEIFKSVNLSDVKKMNDEFISIVDKIFNLEYKVKARSDSTEKLVDLSLFDTFVKSTLDLLKSKYNYTDLYDSNQEDQSVKDLTTLLTKYLNIKENNEDLIIKIKSSISNYLINNKIIERIENEDPIARGYLAMKLFNTIGTVDNSLLTYNSDLSLNRVSIIQQNDLALQVLGGWFVENPQWQLRAKGSSFTFYDIMNPNIKITMRDSIKSGVFETVCNASNDIISKFSKKPQTSEAIISEILDSQKLLLENLLSIKPVIRQGK